ncbi:MAG: hypothetical protein ABI440_07790 [Casimicrobiaceae bacterium]
MSIKDKKEAILQKLQLTNDEQLIEDIYELLNFDDLGTGIEINKLPEELQDKINRAIDDYKNGRYITHHQMQKKVRQWLIS